MITFDLHALLVKSKGGNCNSLRSVDEFSGDQQVWATANKTAQSVFKTIMYLVYQRYNAYGHKVTAMMCDSEPSLLALVGMLRMMGIVLSFSPLGQHAQRIERFIGFSDDRKAACLAFLPYYLPPELDIYTDQ